MKTILSLAIMMALLAVPTAPAKDLVAYFSAQGHTQAVAERIAELTGADLYRIQAAEPYADNPYDDSDRIQDEAYRGLRPAVADAPSQEWIDGYDRIFIGTPCWWHQPAMVVCTFLESYDLSKHVIVPFVTYGATTYLNETMQTLYRSTPESVHVPAVLPEDLDPDDITVPGRPDDAGIDMPGNARGVEGWLSRLGLTGDSGVTDITARQDDDAVSVRTVDGEVSVTFNGGNPAENTVAIHSADGALLRSASGRQNYTFTLPRGAVYILSAVSESADIHISRKIAL